MDSKIKEFHLVKDQSSFLSSVTTGKKSQTLLIDGGKQINQVRKYIKIP